MKQLRKHNHIVLPLNPIPAQSCIRTQSHREMGDNSRSNPFNGTGSGRIKTTYCIPMYLLTFGYISITGAKGLLYKENVPKENPGKCVANISTRSKSHPHGHAYMRTWGNWFRNPGLRLCMAHTHTTGQSVIQRMVRALRSARVLQLWCAEPRQPLSFSRASSYDQQISYNRARPGQKSHVTIREQVHNLVKWFFFFFLFCQLDLLEQYYTRNAKKVCRWKDLVRSSRLIWVLLVASRVFVFKKLDLNKTVGFHTTSKLSHDKSSSQAAYWKLSHAHSPTGKILTWPFVIGSCSSQSCEKQGFFPLSNWNCDIAVVRTAPCEMWFVWFHTQECEF